jgi:hypothetical protein
LRGGLYTAEGDVAERQRGTVGASFSVHWAAINRRETTLPSELLRRASSPVQHAAVRIRMTGTRTDLGFEEAVAHRTRRAAYGGEHERTEHTHFAAHTLPSSLHLPSCSCPGTLPSSPTHALCTTIPFTAA